MHIFLQLENWRLKETKLVIKMAPFDTIKMAPSKAVTKKLWYNIGLPLSVLNSACRSYFHKIALLRWQVQHFYQVLDARPDQTVFV